jgi:hypothetical protein
MIQDGLNIFSNLASGDAPTAIADNASGSVIDQQVSSGLFTEGGSAEKGLWCIVRAITAFTTSASGTIQAVLQDSADNVTFADVLLGTSVAAATAVQGYDLLNARLPFTPKLRRYIRVVYRIGTGVMTAGACVAFLTPDEDASDLSQRKATGVVSKPSGASDMSVGNGIAAS